MTNKLIKTSKMEEKIYKDTNGTDQNDQLSKLFTYVNNLSIKQNYVLLG